MRTVVGRTIAPGCALGLNVSSKIMVTTGSAIAGTRLEMNPAAMAKPSIIANDPYGEGRLVHRSTHANLERKPKGFKGEALIGPIEAKMALGIFEGVLRA